MRHGYRARSGQPATPDLGGFLPHPKQPSGSARSVLPWRPNPGPYRRTDPRQLCDPPCALCQPDFPTHVPSQLPPCASHSTFQSPDFDVPRDFSTGDRLTVVLARLDTLRFTQNEVCPAHCQASVSAFFPPILTVRLYASERNLPSRQTRDAHAPH